MAKVEITTTLFKKIKKKFKAEGHKIIDLLESLEKNPKKGKPIGQIQGILIKEIKYKSFRFYCITDGNRLKIADNSELIDHLIKFIEMSHKNNQQETIEKVKDFLRKFEKDLL